jgi:hypothetical protein
VSSPLDRELAADDASPYLPRWARDRAAQDRTPSSNVESFEPDPDTHWPEQRFVIDGYRVPVSLAPPPPPGTPWHVPTVRSLFGRLGLALAIATASVVGLFSIGISTAPDATDKRPTSFESRFSGQANDPRSAKRDSGRLSQPSPRFGAAPDGSSTARPALGARGMEWRRLPPPQDWADRNSLAPAPADIRGQLFSNNILETGTRDGAEDRNALSRRFLDWQQMQPGGYAGSAPARP